MRGCHQKPVQLGFGMNQVHPHPHLTPMWAAVDCRNRLEAACSLGFGDYGSEYIKPVSHAQDATKAQCLLCKHSMKGIV